MMNRYYVLALAVIGAGLATVVWSLVDFQAGGEVALIAGSAAIPLAIVLFVSARLNTEPPWVALIGGGTIGVAIAILSHAIVFAFSYAFFLGFADEAAELLDALRVDPRVTALVDSPWTVVLMVELVVVAPLTEEVGKAVGSRLLKVDDRRSAFHAGVLAGAGFAVIENIFYASGAGFLGEAWQSVAIARMLGAAVHPLASGIVVLAWWEWRHAGDTGLAVRRFLIGAGVHALWNGSLVVIAVAGTAFDLGGASQAYAVASLSYSAALGVIAAAALWRVAASLADTGDLQLSVDPGDGRALSAWALLSASLLVPVAMLLLAFPAFGT